MIDGTFRHMDSIGGGGLITNGDTQWMTAGAGILHIEAPPSELVAAGGLFHGIQLWVNLPRADKMIAPAYQDLGAGDVALLATPDGGALLRLIAGDLGGHAGPGSTHSPMAMVHATVAAGASVTLPWDPAFNALVYVLSGEGTVGEDRRPVAGGQLAVYGPGGSITFGRVGRAVGADARTRRPHPGRPSDPRARLRLRPVRHEHQGRGGPGLRGLPGREAGAGARPLHGVLTGDRVAGRRRRPDPGVTSLGPRPPRPGAVRRQVAIADGRLRRGRPRRTHRPRRPGRPSWR